jgi:Inosine-uridine nucleoside N-ribohydrolase
MGGAALSAGNATPAAEANFRNDPVAARRVVADADPFVAGLDACNRATVTQALIEAFRDRPRPLPQVADWLDYPEFVRATGPTDDPIIHDAVVIADLVADVLTYEAHPLEVDTSAGPSRGALVADLNRVSGVEPNARVATAVDTDLFRATLRETVDRLV